MNRALLPAEMLHCTDSTVLERQRARLKWQHEQQQQQQQQVVQFEQFGGSGCLGEVVRRSVVKADPGSFVVDNNGGWPDLVEFDDQLNNNYGICSTSSCPSAVVEAPAVVKGRESLAVSEKLSSVVVSRESFQKRKLDKVVAEEDIKEKRIKGCAAGEGETKITEKNANKSSSSTSNNKNSYNNNHNNSSNNKENSAETSKDNSKVTEVQKPDYIHVRARRGQATDSHSLAERVRREKISERMKYLQDLVPGCNKITGKAGMLDEIINYVQSLQRQVEFLSMKLAAVNPRLDFNIDNFFAKEAFSACATNFPAIGMSSDMTNPAYLHFNPVQQQLVTCGLDMGVNPPDLGLRRTISAPISLPETFLDSSCFTQIQPSSTWDADLQNLYHVAFDQARSTSFQPQPFTGSIEASNLKMEM